jgi:anti-sigma factor RsiW
VAAVTDREACDDRRADLGAAAIGRLDAAELAALDAHVASCEACRAERARLVQVAALLPLFDPSTPPSTGAPPELELRVLERIADERQRARRRRSALVAGGIAAAVLVGVVALSVTALRGDDQAEVDGIEVAFADAPAGVDASALIVPDGDATLVSLDVTGLDPGIVYALWLSDDDGERAPAGTFKPEADGRARVALPCAMQLADAARIWATTPDGEVPLDAWFDRDG